ncbi:MAG: hypothetical protein NTU85_03555 [Candidatus Kaiserbacteria bacterium]|nr:hypothetical protein [Candidatus Kaiserbacteria bacterium]
METETEKLPQRETEDRAVVNDGEAPARSSSARDSYADWLASAYLGYRKCGLGQDEALQLTFLYAQFVTEKMSVPPARLGR